MPKILIADDESYIRLLMEQALEKLEDEGATLLFADNGEKALETIRNEKPELVFLDIMMPKMSGIDVCKEVKSDDSVKNAYVVILTAKGQEIDKKKGTEAGADLYMTKPFNPDVILKTAREVLGRRLD